MSMLPEDLDSHVFEDWKTLLTDRSLHRLRMVVLQHDGGETGEEIGDLVRFCRSMEEFQVVLYVYGLARTPVMLN